MITWFKKAQTVDVDSTDTLVGLGSTFEGNIKSSAGVRVEGFIRGDIECSGDAAIGESAEVRSTILCRNATVAGSVYGNLDAEGLVRVLPNGKVFGDISCAAIIIEEGGFLQGRVQMDKAASAGAKTANAKPAVS